ncbi:MAG: hypothetical protein WC314_26145 [Vulcanimicrobiota bacterium]
MSQSLVHIRETLEREIPEIRTGEPIGVLFGLFFSVAVLASAGILFGVIFFPNGGAPSLVGIPSLILGGSYLMGAKTAGSSKSTHLFLGSVYGAVKHFRERDKPPVDKRSTVGAVFVERLLTDGPTKENELFRTSGLASYSLEEKRAALAALSKSDLVENLATGVQLARGVRDKF